MNRRSLLRLLAATGLAAPTLRATGQGRGLAGQPAPDFALVDVAGKPVRLADLRGRYVVLEWNNPSCPFVRKHYDSGNMQALQKRFTAAKVAWLTINSTAANHPEFRKPAEMARWMNESAGAPTALLLDPDGRVGRAYDARVTPHMYVIDPKGMLIYAGAIDDRRSSVAADTKTAKNYVVAALTDAQAGRPVGIGHTQAYGCTIKYAD